tara:strand:+ start:600 stop:833 length:234 start_codon:yes stop_codon:yes gene_type:complete
MSKKSKTLPKKGIKTFFGEIADTAEGKEYLYAEVCHIEDNRIMNAQAGLYSRLTKAERMVVFEWTRLFKGLVGGVGE